MKEFQENSIINLKYEFSGSVDLVLGVLEIGFDVI